MQNLFHNTMALTFEQEGNKLLQKAVHTADTDVSRINADAFPNFSIAILDQSFGGVSAATRGVLQFCPGICV